MSLAPWDELRTALHVARAGTVSGGAQALGVHHATVIRHIDALEDRLGVKLFQRHAKGYAVTEAGRALAEVAESAEQGFEALAARLQGFQSNISGDLVVTTVPELSLLVMPAIADLLAAYPGLKPCLRTETRVLQLEYGEAHLAIRAGQRPAEPDNVVQKLGDLPVGLYASPSYLDRHGRPQGRDGLAGHSFVAPETSRAPYDQWLARSGYHVVLRSNDMASGHAAIATGLGLGFLTPALAAGLGLDQVVAPQADWAAEIWLVTHVDLHRSAKVQAAATAIKRHLSTVLHAG